MADDSLLTVEGLAASIGAFSILTDISLTAPRGDATVILGRNGAGKTTTLRSVLGFQPTHRGSVVFDGVSLVGLDPYRIARLGIGYVPERRGMFSHLTVEENLRVAEQKRGRPRGEVLDLFPILRERLRQPAGALSGGQQQMLALARAMLQAPKLLVLDEPTKGLAPLAIDELVTALQALRGDVTILVVEQNLDAARRLSQHFTVIDDGVTVAAGETSELGVDSRIIDEYLTISIAEER